MKKCIYFTIVMLALMISGCSSDDENFPSVVADFSADIQKIFEEETISFTDLSTGEPTNWQWTFEGGTPATSNEQNPNVLYASEGTYKVTLSVNNGGATDSITKEMYITVLDNLSNGLVGKFDLNGNGNDASEFNNNGTVVGSVTSAKNRENETESAMSFSGGYIDIGDVSELKFTKRMSIATWIKTDGNQSGWDTIANKWSGEGYYLGLRPNRTLRWNVSSQIVESMDPLPVNDWVHVVVTFDEDKLKIYINGVLNNQTDRSFDCYDNTASFRIGQQSDRNDGAFSGEIDDLYVYNRSITANEVVELYEK